MILDNFEFINFDLNDKNHIIFLDKIISSPNSEINSRDIKRFVRRNIERNKKDKITNCFIVKYNSNLIGLSFLNYHPEEIRDNKILLEEIEIGLGLLPEYRGQGLGSLFEKEFSDYLLNLYPRFNEVVARIDKNNIGSINAIMKAGFIKITEGEYHFKRKW